MTPPGDPRVEERGRLAFLEPDRASRARSLGMETAHRLLDPKQTESIVRQPDNVDPIYGASMWSGGSLSHGLAGTAVLFATLEKIEPSFQSVTHNHLSEAVHQLSWNPRAGLMGGVAGVLAATQEAAEGGQRYGNVRAKLAKWLAGAQHKLVTEYASSLRDGVHWNAYDLMNGLSGTLRVLLDETSAEAENATKETVSYFCSRILARPTSRLPGWWVPADLQPTADDAESYPHGDLNLGLAHGVPGVLSALVSVGETQALTTEIEDALTFATGWALRWIQTDGNTQYWPARIPAEFESDPATAPPLFTRAAWCYGTPGVAITMIRAGRLLGNTELIEKSTEALLSHLDRPEAEWRLDGPTFCHGYAGVVQVLYRCWRITGDDRLRTLANRLAETLVTTMADLEAPFVFQHWVPDSPDGWRSATKHRHLNCAGLLEGAAGVACTLLEVSGSEEPDSAADWDRVLGLS